MKSFIRLSLVCSVLILSACSNTWEGVKQDSREAGAVIGEATKNAGKAIQQAVE